MSTPPTFESVRAALDCIPPDLGHDMRVRLAFAVFEGLGDAGAELWQEWAGRRSKPDPAEDRATWKSARKRGPVTVATLFGVAKEHGFRFESVQTSATKPSAADLKAQAEARRAAQESEAKAKAARERDAARDAAKLWESGALEGASAYLDRKGIKAHGVRFASLALRNIRPGDLLVPMRDAAGELHSVQGIGDDKRFFAGARASGGLFHLIGEPAGAAWLLVGEGYATAASCHEATGRPAVVAFTAGNLAHVVRAIRGRYPVARLLICGDDDRATMARTGKNPGRDKATAAARLAHAPAVFPESLPADGSAGSDFNDLHQRAGLDKVRELIEGAIAAAESAATQAKEGPKGKTRTRSTTPAEETAPAGRQPAARGGSESADDDGGDMRSRDRFRADEDGV